MSQRVIKQSHVVERTCDGCGFVKVVDLATATEEEVREMAAWFAVGRKTFIEGRPVQQTMEAHTLDCIPAAALKLIAIPVEPEDSNVIDINSLRANHLEN
jgi:hypothetical protein